MNISKVLSFSVALVIGAAPGVGAQTGSYEDAMKQAEQYQKQLGGGVPGAPGAMPNGVPGAMPGGMPGAAGMPGAGGMPGMPGMMPGAAAGGPPAAMAPPIALTEGDVTSFVGALKGLKDLGIEGDVQGAGESAESIAANAKAMQVLESNGFTPEKFKSVSYSIGMAMAGLEAKKDNIDITAQRADAARSIDEMKTQMPAAQFDAMSRQLKAVDTMLGHIETQPTANLDIVAPHRAEIESLVAQDED